MSDFQATIDDLNEFHDLMKTFLESIPSDAWTRRTGTRGKDWTLHETLAHLVSIAKLFNRGVSAAAHDRVIHIPGLTQRADLAAWNQSQIETFVHTPPLQLAAGLLDALQQAIQLAENLTPEQANRTIFVRPYNRPSRAIDFIEWQLSHAGIIHAAQITRPLWEPPLWERFSPGLIHRQIDRFLRHMSAAYWQDYAGDLHAAINFQIGTEQGGDWHIWMASDGGRCGRGLVENAAYNIVFQNPQTLFGVFTVHIPFPNPIKDGRLRIEGDLDETLKVIRLFSATPPRKT